MSSSRRAPDPKPQDLARATPAAPRALSTEERKLVAEAVRLGQALHDQMQVAIRDYGAWLVERVFEGDAAAALHAAGRDPVWVELARRTGTRALALPPATLYLALRVAARLDRGDHQDRPVDAATEHAQQLAAAGIETLRPDLLVEVSTTDGWELRWFVEVDRGTEHLPTVIRKCQTYERYWRSGREADHHEVFPRVLWSVPTERRADAVRAAIAGTRLLTTELYEVAVAAETTAVITNNNDNQKGGQP